MVTDRGSVGVLDAGDVFTIIFKRPISGVNGPSSTLVFIGPDGQTGSLSHPNAEFDFTETSKSITVTIRQTDLVGFPVPISVPMPAIITRLSGVTSKKGTEFAAQVSPCSKDVTLD